MYLDSKFLLFEVKRLIGSEWIHDNIMLEKDSFDEVTDASEEQVESFIEFISKTEEDTEDPRSGRHTENLSENGIKAD